MANPWTSYEELPPGPAAVLAALHVAEPKVDALISLADAEWRTALDYCDRGRLTFALHEVARDAMPAWVRERIEGNAKTNREREARIAELYRTLHGHLSGAGIEFIALKGLTHAGISSGAPPRVQYDIDLFAPPSDAQRAQQLLIARGWRPIAGMEAFPTDHFPALLRDTKWRWRGDYFDPELPVAVELHFQFWNQAIERLSAPDADAFWARRTVRQIAGVEMGVLRRHDALAYAALHLLRHLLRGSVMPFHVYEIARLLDSLSEHDDFWHAWARDQGPEMRRLEAVVFRLAECWFGCRMAQQVASAIDALPADTQRWFAEYALAPASAKFHPNKDELWLHFSLLSSRRECWRVARRRLLPSNLPPRLGLHALGRLRHHLLALPRAGIIAVRWKWPGTGATFTPQFLWFLAAAAIFNFALFIFVLLYNLFLLDLGFREDFVGLISSATRLGSLAGALPFAIVAQRLGLKRTLILTIAGTAAAEFFRAVVGASLPLVTLAFLSGAMLSGWAVILAPAIAGAVGEERRARAFSIFLAAMISLGVLGNGIGGHLPVLMGGKRAVLLCAATLSALAILPASRLRSWPMPEPGVRVWPRNRFLALFLVPLALWHLATGAFNPFNNVYFARLGFSAGRIGAVFSASQLAQVGALLGAPLLIRRLGLFPAIALMMAATGCALASLSAQPSPAAAVVCYVAYTSFQWMSEPGLNTLLMARVSERERSGASALTFVVAFAAQALAAFCGGRALTRFGYGWMLAAAAALAMCAAVLFRGLLYRPQPHAPETPAPEIDIARA